MSVDRELSTIREVRGCPESALYKDGRGRDGRGSRPEKAPGISPM
jgi:hypothetical protein